MLTNSHPFFTIESLHTSASATGKGERNAAGGVPPTRLLQSVASGLLGPAAFNDGMPTAALGLFLHFCIALSWAAIFYIESQRFSFLTRRAVIVGILYAILIYAVMNFIVLPLSAIHRQFKFSPVVTGTGVFVHMFFIGLPIALVARSALSHAAHRFPATRSPVV